MDLKLKDGVLDGTFEQVQAWREMLVQAFWR